MADAQQPEDDLGELPEELQGDVELDDGDVGLPPEDVEDVEAKEDDGLGVPPTDDEAAEEKREEPADLKADNEEIEPGQDAPPEESENPNRDRDDDDDEDEKDEDARPKVKDEGKEDEVASSSKPALDQALGAARNWPPKVYETKVTPFRVGFDMTTEEEIEKRKARAKKFGLKYDPIMDIEGISKEDYEERKKRAARFGVTETKEVVMDTVHKYETPYDPQIGPPEDYRYDAIHLYGIVTHWTTKTIFQYFSDYGPSKVEWLNDSSCNIVFPDTFSCKRALTFLSLPIEVELKRVREENPEVENRPDVDFIVWRKGKSLEGHRLLMRVCHKGDVKKPMSQRKPSLYYKKVLKNRKRDRNGMQSREMGDMSRRKNRRMDTNRKREQGNKGMRRKPRAIFIKKKKKEMRKTTNTLERLKIEVENEEVIPVEVEVVNDDAKKNGNDGASALNEDVQTDVAIDQVADSTSS